MRVPVNIKRFLIVFFISLIIIALIIYFTSNKNTLHSIENIKKEFLLLAIFFYIVEFTADALRTKILVKGTNNDITIFECYKLVALQVFFDLITPFSVGGQPFQIYALHKKNVPGGSATTVVVIKLFFGAIVLLTIVIAGLIFKPGIFTETPLFASIINITGFVLLFLFGIFLLGIYNPKITTSFLTILFNKILGKVKIMKNPEKFKSKIMRHIILARDSFDGFVSHKILYSIIALLLTFVMIISTCLIILSCMWGFGIKLDIINGIILSGILIFVITFMPTPGGSGLGEGAFYIIFNNFIPIHLIGVIIFLWRFFTQYFTSVMGAIVTAKYFTELLTSKKIAESG